MERLENKTINGKVYYYYSDWGWVKGKCRRKWQRYLGKLEDIVKACEGGPAPLYADIFQWGLPIALMKEVKINNIIEVIDKICPKREQGMSVGEYVCIAAINRAIRPSSKNSIWQWFSQTSLLRYFDNATKETLSSQRFWDHMDRIDKMQTYQIWKNIIKGLIKRECIELSKISYDGTNFYSFIDTFNVRCSIAKRGKNKQKRYNLRQISYALFCSNDNQLPLYFDVYEGNINDVTHFPQVLKKFNQFLNDFDGFQATTDKITIIFDKGNNSEDNFMLIDQMDLNFVGSVKISDHKELAEIPNSDGRFVSYDSEGIKETKAFRIKKTVYGQEMTLVVTYNQNLFDTQCMTIHSDVNNVLKQLSALQQKLNDRASGLVKKGPKPTVHSIKQQCKEILSRQYMKKLILCEVKNGGRETPKLEYYYDASSFKKLADTYLGKNILITNRHEWSNYEIIKAYRSQFNIENIFQEMKDRTIGSWWPLYHWTDSKIYVHALYITIAILIRNIMRSRLKSKNIHLSMKRLMSELDDIREVINIYPQKKRRKKECRQSVLSRTTELQDKLISILGLKEFNF